MSSRAGVTRDVDPAAVRDLVTHPPRATVAFAAGGRADLLPAKVSAAGERYLFGVAAGMAPDLAGAEVVLVIDDGPYWFELRGLSIRGVATRVAPPAGETARLVWHAITPRRVLAWDYGAIREA
jgi:hypothetical protein